MSEGHARRFVFAFVALLFAATSCGPHDTHAVSPVHRDAPVVSTKPASLKAASPAGPNATVDNFLRVSRYRYGCFDSTECRAPDAVCQRASVIGQCSCHSDDDCLPSETCYARTCELRCSHAPNGCPRGGSCISDFFKFCVDDRHAAEDGFGLTEWLDKAEERLPGHAPHYLHATYDEWDGDWRHLRVSFRGDGDYVIELDGIGAWNRSVVGSEHPNAKGRELLHTGILRGRGATPEIAELTRGSCPGPLSTFRAELVLVAEFATLSVYRGLWTHPDCPSFPRGYVESIWGFVEHETGGAVERFDWKRHGSLPPVDTPTATPDLNRLPCWPGQSWTGKACRGRPTTCPTSFTPSEDGCSGCNPGRVRVGLDGACCWPGQTRNDNACRGIPICPEGFAPSENQGCTRQPEPPVEKPHRPGDRMPDYYSYSKQKP